MKEIVLQRLKELIEFKELSINAFSKVIGVEQTTLNNQIIGRRALSLDVILRTIDSIPDVSAEWLLRGEGHMLKAVKYDVQDEEQCMGSFSCPISPKVAALEDADAILGADKEKALAAASAILSGTEQSKADLDSYIRSVVDRRLQELQLNKVS